MGDAAAQTSAKSATGAGDVTHLYSAVAQVKLGVLVDELEQESGPASPQAYERVLAQWFADGVGEGIRIRPVRI